MREHLRHQIILNILLRRSLRKFEICDIIEAIEYYYGKEAH